MLYDGALEGIRNGCPNSGAQCEFHSKFDNPALLLNGWSGRPMQRVHPPVPDYNLSSELGEFHYCMPDQVKNRTFQEKFSLTKEKVPVNAEEREVNDYCRRTQLRKMFLSCVEPCLSFQEEKCEDF